MIHIRCVDDCGAEIVVPEKNRPIQCWNCGRAYTLDKRGNLIVSAQPKTAFPTLTEERATT